MRNPRPEFMKPKTWVHETQIWVPHKTQLLGDDFELVEEYFDNSLLTLDFYNALEKCLQRPPGFVVNQGRTHLARAWVHDKPRRGLQALLQGIVDENPGLPGFVVNPGRAHPSRVGFVKNPSTSWVGLGFAKNLARTWVRQEPKMNPPKLGFFTNP
ncbi:hypothetical protein SLEP1_g16215 [Rubroshorea leprosula]|uniref:Uncharacterized protein n=1 Tax=Rubroshorea leprosula TaxID=152421 RepID=A0AAV5IQ72_9ROSI|nr:hypothetical protein SLEP1_g16215 [Rubroshorea leprosula]